MSKTVAELKEEFDPLAKSAQTLAFAPRGSELQKEMCQRIDAFLTDLSVAKAHAVGRCDEDGANTALAMELSLKVVQYELRMWIDLKSDAGESAWDNLIEAQYHCIRAIDVREQLEGSGAAARLENLLSKLLVLEKVVFPPQTFNSVGGRVIRRKCSICHRPYDECEHIKGHAYMGEMCATHIEEMELEEISIVTEPANKHCRITHFSDAPGKRNTMTWRTQAE